MSSVVLTYHTEDVFPVALCIGDNEGKGSLSK